MKTPKENITIILLIITVLCVAGLYTAHVIIKNNEIKKNDNEASYSLSVNSEDSQYTSLEGETVDLTRYVGEILIVNSWASWSPDSAKELPMLVELAGSYEEFGVKVVAINRSEPAATAERFLSLIEVSDKVELILDPEDRFYSSIAGYSMPETIIYDKSGKIIYHGRGVVNKNDLKHHLDNLIDSYKE
jgi:thiol-disulfide isomerase/thioredoxin